MKKILLFLFVLLNTNTLLHSQIIDPIQIKNEVKEFLAIHMLLLKSDSDEFKEFLEEYKYIVALSNEEQFILLKQNENMPSPYIIVPKKLDDHIQSRLVVLYSLDDDTKLDYSVGADIHNSIVKSFIIDCPSNFKCTDMFGGGFFDQLEKQFTDEKKKFSRYSEYALLLHSENDENNRHGKPELFRATNFMSFKETEGVLFSSPVKQVIMIYPVLQDNEDGSYTVKFSIESLWSEEFTKTDSFDYKEFMSLENLNDKIW